MKLGGLFGLGAGTPSRFPYPDRPQPGQGVAPSSGAVFRGRLVLVFGPSGTVSGVFVYAPGTTPGAGNTPIAAMTASATDPFGNDVTPGDASSSGTIIAIGAAPSGGTPSFVQLAPGNPASMLISSGDSAEATAGHIDSLISGGGAARNLNLRLTSPKVTGFPSAASQVLLTSEAADGSQAPAALLQATDGVNSAALEVTPTGTVVIVGPFTSLFGSAARPSNIQTDVWHAAAVVNGWASTTLKYKLTAFNSVRVLGVIDPAAQTSTTFFTLPAGYRPATTQDHVVSFHLTVAANVGIFIRANNTGTLVAVNSATTSGVLVIDIDIPLDY